MTDMTHPETAFITAPNGDVWSLSIEIVTPLMAEAYLAKNTSNRRIRKSTVTKYTSIIREGGWSLTPEPVVFGEDGVLMNGQHRLSAVVSAGSPATFLVIRGVDPSVFKTLDRGATRSTADALKADKKATEVARLAAVIALAKAPALVTDDQTAKFLAVLGDSHSRLMDACNTSARIFSSAPFRLAAVLSVIIDRDVEYVHSTYRNLVIGHISDLPPICQNAVGSVMSNRWSSLEGGSGPQTSNLVRAWDLFDPEKASNSRVMIKSTQSRVDALAAICRSLIEET